MEYDPETALTRLRRHRASGSGGGSGGGPDGGPNGDSFVIGQLGQSLDGRIATPTGASCSGGTTRVYSPYTATTCTGTSQLLTHNGGCATLTANPGRMDYTPGTASGGNCTASSVSPTGGAYEDDLYTLCCIPAN